MDLSSHDPSRDADKHDQPTPVAHYTVRGGPHEPAFGMISLECHFQMTSVLGTHEGFLVASLGRDRGLDHYK